MSRKILITAAILGVTGIVLGAFGAHGLKKIVSPQAIESYKTGVEYQQIHALFLLFLGLFADKHPSKKMKSIFYLALIGVILFSGSIYLLSLKEPLNLGVLAKILGPITPIGGLLLIAAWTQLLFYFIQYFGKEKQ